MHCKLLLLFSPSLLNKGLKIRMSKPWQQGLCHWLIRFSIVSKIMIALQGLLKSGPIPFFQSSLFPNTHSGFQLAWLHNCITVPCAFPLSSLCQHYFSCLECLRSSLAVFSRPSFLHWNPLWTHVTQVTSPSGHNLGPLGLSPYLVQQATVRENCVFLGVSDTRSCFFSLL